MVQLSSTSLATVLDGVRGLAGLGFYSHHSLVSTAATGTNLSSTTFLKQQSRFFNPLGCSAPAQCASFSTSNPYFRNVTDAVSRRWQNLQFRVGRDPRKPAELRKKVVVLGTGWAAVNFIDQLDVTEFDITVVSPRNYFAFTPLLPSVCAGTLSPRSCLEPIRDRMLRGGKPVMTLHEAWATELNTKKVRLTLNVFLFAFI